MEFLNVSFRYETEEESVLRDLTVRLAPGRVLGLLGRTGSGKTTFARLLFRLYDVTAGEIRPWVACRSGPPASATSGGGWGW